jgi:hypothetical protein
MAKSNSIAFVYPSSPRERKHGPSGYKDVQSFRPWLRDEFVFRCVYCLKRESWGTAKEGFDIEHFVSSMVAPEKRLTYSNLIYACHECNLRKGSASVDDPLQFCIANDIALLESGMLVGLSQKARLIIAVVALNSPNMIRWRLLWMQIIELAQTHDFELLNQLMAFPNDLPDLAALNPPANEKPAGVYDSFYAQSQSGNLPASYIV